MTWKVNSLAKPEFDVIHGLLMIYPNGQALSHLDPSVRVVLDAGFVKQRLDGKYYLTSDGLRHLEPFMRKRLAQAAGG